MIISSPSILRNGINALVSIVHHIVHQPASGIRKRLSLIAQKLVRYYIKAPYQDGTTPVVLEPLDFIVRLTLIHSAVL